MPHKKAAGDRTVLIVLAKASARQSPLFISVNRLFFLNNHLVSFAFTRTFAPSRFIRQIALRAAFMAGGNLVRHKVNLTAGIVGFAANAAGDLD